MTLPARRQQSLRLPEDMTERLRRAAKHRGLTQQALMQIALVRTLEEVEEEMRAKREDRQRRREAEALRRADNAPVGLGIVPRVAPEADPVPPPAPQGQVVVNVGGGSAGASEGGDAISCLATYVATGPEFDRDVRLRSAVDVLRASCGSREDAAALAEKLDAAIAARIKERPNGTAAAMRALGLSFDKLSALFS